jgi:hypothetical protein
MCGGLGVHTLAEGGRAGPHETEPWAVSMSWCTSPHVKYASRVGVARALSASTAKNSCGSPLRSAKGLRSPPLAMSSTHLGVPGGLQWAQRQAVSRLSISACGVLQGAHMKIVKGAAEWWCGVGAAMLD